MRASGVAEARRPLRRWRTRLREQCAKAVSVAAGVEFRGVAAAGASNTRKPRMTSRGSSVAVAAGVEFCRWAAAGASNERKPRITSRGWSFAVGLPRAPAMHGSFGWAKAEVQGCAHASGVAQAACLARAQRAGLSEKPFPNASKAQRIRAAGGGARGGGSGAPSQRARMLGAGRMLGADPLRRADGRNPKYKLVRMLHAWRRPHAWRA